MPIGAANATGVSAAVPCGRKVDLHLLLFARTPHLTPAADAPARVACGRCASWTATVSGTRSTVKRDRGS
eukprot:1115613-Prymnesium_polylepis.1